MKKQAFLKLLEEEAGQQAKLQKRKILPDQLSGIWSFVAEHTWQVLLVISATLALYMTVLDWLVMVKGVAYV